MVGGSSMIRFPLVIAVSERDMPGIKPGPIGWHTSVLTNELQEVRLVESRLKACLDCCRFCNNLVSIVEVTV